MVNPQVVQQMVDTALDMFGQAVLTREQANLKMAAAVEYERTAHEFRAAAEAERDAAVKWKRAGRWALWANLASVVFCVAMGLVNLASVLW